MWFASQFSVFCFVFGDDLSASFCITSTVNFISTLGMLKYSSVIGRFSEMVA